MANITEARINISLTNCANEFKEFLDTAQKDAYYFLCRYTDFNIGDNNSAEISGDADGQWAFRRNIEGYFPELGTIDKDPGWLSAEAVEAYKKLLQSITDNGGKVEIEYDDLETSIQYIATGRLTIERDKRGEAAIERHYEDHDFTAENLVKYSGYDKYEAKEMIENGEIS